MNNSNAEIDFEYVLQKIKPSGRFQILALLVICYNSALCGMIGFQGVWISYTPDFRCNVDPLDNETVYPYLSEQETLNYTTPHDGNRYDGCHRYGYDLSECTGSLDCVNTSADAIPCDKGYHYDTSLFTETTVTQFDLVCDRRIYFTIEASTFMLAYPLGALIMGPLTDKFGRKVIAVVMGICTSICMGIMIFSPTFYFFGICRFLLSMCTSATYLSTFVYILEVTGVNSYAMYGLLVQVFFAAGYTLWSGIAYIWRDWHEMQMFCFLLTLPFILFAIFLPESPRWLFSVGNEKEAKKIIRLIANVNGTSQNVTEEMWESAILPPEKKENNDNIKEIKPSLFAIFKKGRIRMISIIVVCAWAAHSLVYYGIGFSAGKLPGNLFITNLFGGAFEMAAYVICIFALNYFGRVTTMVFCLLFTGICLILSTILFLFDTYPVLLLCGTILAYLGKAAVGGSWGVIYNYTCEIYSTDVRGNANGWATLGGGVASGFYPFILSLYLFFQWLPGTIFAIIAITAGLASLKLPETKDVPHLNTIQEAEIFYKSGIRKRVNKMDDSEFVNENFEVNFTTKF